MAPKQSVFSIDPTISTESNKTTLGPNVYPLPLPRGLASPYDSPVWVFPSRSQTGLASIRWDRKLPDGTRLTDPINESLLDSAKRFLTVLIEDPAGWFSVMSVSTALNRTHTFLSIIEWVVRLGYRRLSDVTWQDWVRFRGKLPNGIRTASGDPSSSSREVLTDSRILEVFRVVQCAYVFRSQPLSGMQLSRDGFSFAPFDPGEDPKKLARSMGVRPGQTPSIPPPIALHCLDAAIQYVVLFADDIIELNAKRRAEATADRPRRRAPGELLNEVKHCLVQQLRGASTIPITADGRIFRSRFAEQLGVPASSLSEHSVSRTLIDFERALASSDERDRLSYLRSLEHDLGNTRARKPAPPPRDMDKRIGLPFWGKHGSAAPWPINSVGSSRFMNGMTLERATSNLWTAIFIVIETLLADRLGESLSAEIGCTYKQIDGSYMVTPSFKPTNSQAGVENGRPCPEVAVRAVEVATRLGAYAREKLGSNLLFTSEHRLGVSVIDETTIRKRLQSFASDVGAPTDEDGEEWHLAPHQLRRFLATTWAWYYELGPGLEALRTFMRHSDIDQTVRYAADEKKAMVTEEQVSMTASILERAAFEGLDVFGPFGKRWKRLAAQINIKFVDFKEKGNRLRELIVSRQISFFPNPWGYCAWSKKAGIYAKCLAPEERRGGLPRPQTRKHAETCADCANCIITEVFAPFWAEAEARHEMVASRTNIPDVLREAARKGVIIARRICREMGGA